VKELLDGAEDPVIDLLIHDARHPPGTALLDALADELAIGLDRLRREPDRLVQELLVPVARHDQRQSLAQDRCHTGRVDAILGALLNQLFDLLVGERLESLGHPARQLRGDPLGIGRLGQPFARATGDAHAAELGRDRLPGQEMMLHEIPDDPADAVLLPADDRGCEESAGRGDAGTVR
jgi:hypothetical protein